MRARFGGAPVVQPLCSASYVCYEVYLPLAHQLGASPDTTEAACLELPTGRCPCQICPKPTHQRASRSRVVCHAATVQISIPLANRSQAMQSAGLTRQWASIAATVQMSLTGVGDFSLYRFLVNRIQYSYNAIGNLSDACFQQRRICDLLAANYL
jgi:hypothetical protein